jgi:hypothetical protein
MVPCIEWRPTSQDSGYCNVALQNLKSQEAVMTDEEKAKSEESKAADEMDSEMNEREEDRLEDERAEQQDLNQGMDTGTHSGTRSGVNWGRSYQNLNKPAKPADPKKSDSE